MSRANDLGPFIDERPNPSIFKVNGTPAPICTLLDDSVDFGASADPWTTDVLAATPKTPALCRLLTHAPQQAPWAGCSNDAGTGLGVLTASD
jgi:hypothetical protein